MKALKHAALLGAFTLVFISAEFSMAAPPIAPDERDRQVLEVALLHLLADAKLDMTKVPAGAGTMLLHARTPEKTGFIQSEQMRHDIGKNKLPGDVEQDLQRRNSVPGTYDAVQASFASLKFTNGIAAVDLTGMLGGRLAVRAFQQAHPKARGWAEAYLPGYSKDGTLALVRAGIGPSDHGAMVTVLLEKRREKWVVKWHFVARYV